MVLITVSDIKFLPQDMQNVTSIIVRGGIITRPIALPGTLSKLVLNRVIFTDGGCVILTNPRSLTHLDLYDSKDVTHSMFSGACNLEYLNMSSTDLGDEMLKLLSKCKNLKTLIANRTKITDYGMRFLVRLPITRLSVENCDFINCNGSDFTQVLTSRDYPFDYILREMKGGHLIKNIDWMGILLENRYEIEKYFTRDELKRNGFYTEECDTEGLYSDGTIFMTIGLVESIYNRFSLDYTINFLKKFVMYGEMKYILYRVTGDSKFIGDNHCIKPYKSELTSVKSSIKRLDVSGLSGEFYINSCYELESLNVYDSEIDTHLTLPKSLVSLKMIYCLLDDRFVYEKLSNLNNLKHIDISNNLISYVCLYVLHRLKLETMITDHYELNE